MTSLVKTGRIISPYATPIIRRYFRRHMPAAERIQRAYRAYRAVRRGKVWKYGAMAAKRAMKLRKYGERKSSDASKRYTPIDTSGTLQATRTLYEDEITAIPQTSTNDIDERQRQVIYFSGVKICWELKNNEATPLHFNIAVIAPKEGLDDAVATGEFFRGTGTERGLDFSNSLNSNDFWCRPINRDIWTIVKHWRFQLNSDTNGISGVHQRERGSSYMRFSRWVPIKKQIRYRGLNSTNCLNKMYVVYWADRFMEPGGTTPLSNAFTVSKRYVTYFREPKML